MNKIYDRTLKQVNRERRQILEMIGKAGVSFPLLKSSALLGGIFASRYAQAQTTKKLVLVWHPNGSPDGRWHPDDDGVATQPFVDAGHVDQRRQGNVSFREMNIRLPGNHGNIQQSVGATEWSGTSPKASSFNLQYAKTVGQRTSWSSIELGVDTKGTQGGINRLNGAEVPRLETPQAAFQRIFSGSAPAPTPTPTPGQPSGPSIYERQRRVVETNMRALEAMRNKLSGEELLKAESHLDALEQIERRITLQEDQASNPPPTDGGGGGGGGGASCSSVAYTQGNTPLQHYKAMGDIIASAFACGITNVASIQFNETQASWIPNDGSADAVGGSNYTADHHQANHSNYQSYLPEICAYMNKGLAHLITQLKAQGVYDQTLVICVSEMGDGQNHTTPNGPIILASGIAGFNSANSKSNRDHDTIFNEAAQLLGIDYAVNGTVGRYDYTDWA